MTFPRQRRDVLRSVAAVGLAATVPLAGCTGQSGDESDTQDPDGSDDQAAADETDAQGSTDGAEQNERPSYHRYVPAETAGSEGVSFIALDAERLRKMEDRDLQRELPADAQVNLGGEGGTADADPMLALPGSGLFIATLGLTFGLAPYGFAGNVVSGFTGQFGGQSGPSTGGGGTSGGGTSGGGGASGDGGETSTETDSPHRVDLAVVLGVDSVIAFEGSFDVTALADAATRFERAGEYAGFEVYEGIEAEGSGGASRISSENLAFAVDENRLVALTDNEIDDPRGRLDHALDVAVGDAERLTGDADVDWALRTAGHDLVTFGGWGTEPVRGGSQAQGGTGQGGQSGGGAGTVSVLAAADGVVGSLAVGDEQVHSTLAAVYPDGETPDREAFKAEVGRSAADRTVEFDGTRVVATGTWPTASGTPTAGASGSSGGAGATTTTPGKQYETVVDEQLSSSERYTLEFAAGDEVRVSVDNQEGERTLVYVQQLGGSELPINDQTSSSETWEVTISDGGEYSIDFTVDGQAHVTIEVASS